MSSTQTDSHGMSKTDSMVQVWLTCVRVLLIVVGIPGNTSRPTSTTSRRRGAFRFILPELQTSGPWQDAEDKPGHGEVSGPVRCARNSVTRQQAAADPRDGIRVGRLDARRSHVKADSGRRPLAPAAWATIASLISSVISPVEVPFQFDISPSNGSQPSAKPGRWLTRSDPFAVSRRGSSSAAWMKPSDRGRSRDLPSSCADCSRAGSPPC